MCSPWNNAKGFSGLLADDALKIVTRWENNEHIASAA